MFILQRILMGFFFYVEILCKIFPNFQTWIGFFSTFFLQNQKTRKLCTFIYLELQLSQFSRDLKNQKVGPHPPSTIKIKKKQRSAPGPLGDFCQQQLADFLLYFLFLILSLHFLLITSFFWFSCLFFSFSIVICFSFVFLGFSLPSR